MHYLICGTEERNRIINWEESAKCMVAEFRTAVSEALDNPWVLEVVEKLKTDSVEFDKWWREHDIRDQASGVIELIDELGKKVRIERSALRPWQNPRLRILVFTPLTDKA